jgi:hypothetical protein
MQKALVWYAQFDESALRRSDESADRSGFRSSTGTSVRRDHTDG